MNIWEEYSDNNIPRANLIISYGSSIDNEIADVLDCEFQYYDIRERENISEVSNEIKNKIDRLTVKNSNVK